jgi:hypothetical protein
MSVLSLFDFIFFYSLTKDLASIRARDTIKRCKSVKIDRTNTEPTPNQKRPKKIGSVRRFCSPCGQSYGKQIKACYTPKKQPFSAKCQIRVQARQKSRALCQLQCPAVLCRISVKDSSCANVNKPGERY